MLITDNNISFKGFSSLKNYTHLNNIYLNTYQNIPHNTNIKSNNIPFTGLKTTDLKSMFVFDLDGTLAAATNNQMKTIFDKSKDCNSYIVYATGRTLKEFKKLQNQLFSKDIILPNPDYLVANNGQFLYENIDGLLLENLRYQIELQQRTKYNRDIVTDLMKNFAQRSKYKYTSSELSHLSNLDKVKVSDPEFYDSKISYYEWNPSKNMAEYFLSHDVNTKELRAEIEEELAKRNIKVKFRENHYTKPIMDACNESILLQSNNLRRHKDGSMTALFLCAADKSDGIDYIRKSHGINFSEILMAGNDDNDIPMARLSKKGAKFICLNDSSKNLIAYCQNLKENCLVSLKSGAEAILDGLQIFTK